MRQFVTIAVNAFMELVRQPVVLLLLTVTPGFDVFLASVPYFGFGDDPKLVKDSTLAVMFLAGLFTAVLCASSSVALEIRSGTALAVLAKPIGRARFLLAKYAGLAAVLLLFVYLNLLGALSASRMTFDAYGDVDKPSLFIFLGAIAFAYLIGGFTNYFLRRGFVADTVLALTVTITLAAVYIVFLTTRDLPFGGKAAADWRLAPAAVLILFALWVLAGLAVACSTRWDTIATLAVCSAFFLLGLMSDFFFQARAEQGVWWANVLYGVLPNWQLFWVADALENQKTVPWAYVGKASVYLVGYLGATLALALVLFEDRELS